MQNKIAIVTGASSGIGAELAKKLATQNITTGHLAWRNDARIISIPSLAASNSFEGLA